MTFRKFIISRGITLCMYGIFIIIGVIYLIAYQADVRQILLFTGGVIFLIICWLMISFVLFQIKIKKLQMLSDRMEQKYLLGEILPQPTDELETVYYMIMHQISKSAIETVEEIRLEKEQYREYIENWIHEIKTPLTACSLMVENGCELYRLKSELKKADNLTENILYYARMKQPEKDNVITQVDIDKVVEQAVKDQMSLLIASGNSVKTSVNLKVLTDQKAIQYILTQFLVNTAKYCPNTLIEITSEADCLIYKDYGIGIPSFDRFRITERGFTGENGRKLGTSTGMGLYIVKNLCDQLGIKLNIQSKEQKFTSFTLQFSSLTKM